jgi:hypothetical protein
MVPGGLGAPLLALAILSWCGSEKIAPSLIVVADASRMHA